MLLVELAPVDDLHRLCKLHYINKIELLGAPRRRRT
jgi:hypothetical protein